MASTPSSFVQLLRPKFPAIQPLFLPLQFSRFPLAQTHYPKTTVKCAPNPSNPTSQDTQLENQKRTEKTGYPTPENTQLETQKRTEKPGYPTPENTQLETQKRTEKPGYPTPENTQLENLEKSELLRKSRTSKLDRPEPPNFEIGWKRTKEIKIEKPKGYVIMDFLDKLEGLMIRRQYGSTKLLAKVGEIVSERAMEEAEVLREDGEVEERMVTELGRVLRLMQMDLEMVKAAVKEETLNERLEQAKARCKQAILVANSF